MAERIEVVENRIEPLNGVLALAMGILALVLGVGMGLTAFMFGNGFLGFIGVLSLIVGVLLMSGVSIIHPNEALVLELFGNYHGTIYENGIVFVNPFCSTSKYSLKIRNFQSKIIKVNDKRGNPIELGVTFRWNVKNATKAHYGVEHYENFVVEQVSGIFSSVAKRYNFDGKDHDDKTDEAEKNVKELVFRRDSDEIALDFKKTLQNQIDDAGVNVGALHISHAQYAPEIASQMLQKQQAEATLEARSKIVEGTYKMVEDLIEKFKESKNFTLSEADIAKLSTNVMTVLLSHQDATPVINLS